MSKDLADALHRLAGIRRGIRGVHRHPHLASNVAELLDAIDRELDLLEVDLQYFAERSQR